MNQTELVNITAHRHGLPKNFTDKILKTILNSIVSELKKGALVRLKNFGTFRTRMSRGKERVKFYSSKNILKYYGKENK